MKKGKLSLDEKVAIEEQLAKGHSASFIGKRLDRSEKIIQKYLDETEAAKTKATEPVDVCVPREDSGEFSDAEWAAYWKEKYLEAHVQLVLNGIV